MKIIPLLFSIIIFAGCNQAGKNDSPEIDPSNNFINPPLKNADIPFKEYSVDATKGDTLFYPTGSIILFPPNSFVDKAGNLITGDITVKYQEFRDPLDLYLSGIPMDYDSAGVKYNFISFGMCEVLAFKDGNPVFVNPRVNPEINIAGSDNSGPQNLYCLDTIAKNWINMGKDIVTNLPAEKGLLSTSSENDSLAMPIRPEKANNSSPIIKIVIDSASFKELLVYDNMEFQLDGSEQHFDPNDAKEEWSDVQLLKGNEKGLYKIKFSNNQRTVIYAARPVLEGVNYEKALRKFDQKRKEYEKNMGSLKAKERMAQTKYLKDSLLSGKITEENKKRTQLNLLIESKNRQIKKQNDFFDEMAGPTNYRSFSITRFGAWNIDKPILPDLMPITATFKDEKGNNLPLKNIAVFYKNRNSIFRYPDHNIYVMKNADNMIVGTLNGDFIYLPYDDYASLNINEQTKKQDFIMTVTQGKENNYNLIRDFIGR